MTSAKTDKRPPTPPVSSNSSESESEEEIQIISHFYAGRQVIEPEPITNGHTPRRNMVNAHPRRNLFGAGGGGDGERSPNHRYNLRPRAPLPVNNIPRRFPPLRPNFHAVGDREFEEPLRIQEEEPVPEPPAALLLENPTQYRFSLLNHLVDRCGILINAANRGLRALRTNVANLFRRNDAVGEAVVDNREALLMMDERLENVEEVVYRNRNRDQQN